jgi:hypothetical protein
MLEESGHRVIDLLGQAVEILDVEVHRIQRHPSVGLGRQQSL